MDEPLLSHWPSSPRTSLSPPRLPHPLQRSSGKGWGLPLRYPSHDGSPLLLARRSEASPPGSARILADSGRLLLGLGVLKGASALPLLLLCAHGVLFCCLHVWLDV